MAEEIVWVGLKVIAARVGCGRDLLLRWIHKSGFPAWKQDGTWRALPFEASQWLQQQRMKAQEGHGVRRTGGVSR